MKKDILTDEIIRADIKGELARAGTHPIDVVIVGVACYAFAAFFLFLAHTEPILYLMSGIAFILSTILTVSTIRASVIYSKQKKRLDACDISVSETKLSSVYLDWRRACNKFGSAVPEYHFRFAVGEWCLMNTTLYKWSKEYHLSVDGLENISLEGDEFYAVIDNETQTVVYAYPKKFFEYKKN